MSLVRSSVLFLCLNLEVHGRRNHQDLILTLAPFSYSLFVQTFSTSPGCDVGRDGRGMNDGSSPDGTHTLMTSFCVSYKAAVFLRILLYPGYFKHITAISSLLLSAEKRRLIPLCSVLGFKFAFCPGIVFKASQTRQALNHKASSSAFPL